MPDKLWVSRAGLGALFALIFGLYVFLPSLGLRAYASPDETAQAVAARGIAENGGAAIDEPLARSYPWLHPRSWVSSGSRIVPVGFLGWPWLLSIVTRLFGDGGLPWIGALLALSAIAPFFLLLRERLSFIAAWAGTLVAFSFPSAILYANRGLFASLPVLALGIWGVWILRRLAVVHSSQPAKAGRQEIVLAFFAGFACALSLSMRPSEAAWLIPWWIWAGWHWRPRRNAAFAAILGALFASIPVLLVAKRTYGSVFAVGYWLKDNVRNRIGIMESSVFPASVSVLPYGFHPRNVLWNVRAFLFGLLWPWTFLAIAGFLWFLRMRRKNEGPLFSARDVPWMLGIWTVAAVILMNGNGLYADHVRRGAVTIGNSFLRYVLPLAPIVGWIAAWIVDQLPSRAWKAAGTLVCFALACFGGWRAFAADDEGLFYTRRELKRYAEIRVTISQWFRPGDVILSERSDKIAFPAYRAVSPLPPMEEVGSLARESGIGIGLYQRPLSQEQKDAWRNAGLEVQELAVFGREKLYRLVSR